MYSAAVDHRSRIALWQWILAVFNTTLNYVSEVPQLEDRLF